MATYYEGFHGSPGPAFQTFDTARAGRVSGYDHARGTACLTSSVDVATHYADGDGFVGRFGVSLENPLVLHDSERERGIPAMLESAREAGHDGVVLVGCGHTAVSPGEPSTIIFLFDPSRARRLEVVQEPEGREVDPGTESFDTPAPRRPAMGR